MQTSTSSRKGCCHCSPVLGWATPLEGGREEGRGGGREGEGEGGRDGTCVGQCADLVSSELILPTPMLNTSPKRAKTIHVGMHLQKKHSP